MSEFLFEWLFKPKLKDPVLIEGLPGIGFVGKISADYLLSTYDAERFAEIYSSRFIEAAYVEEETGLSKLPSNELYVIKGEEISCPRDLVILSGDCQPPVRDTLAHFLLSMQIVKAHRDLGGELIITLGGLQTPRIYIPPLIFVSVTDEKIFKSLGLGKNGVQKSNSGRIYGAAGLLLGFAKVFDLRGISLLGTTLGTFPDYYASYHVLKVLSNVLGADIDLSDLEDDMEETKRALMAMKQSEEEKEKRISEKGLDYVG